MSNIAKRIVPLLDRVLIQRTKPLEKTASGLLLPKAAQESLNEGKVISVGPGTDKHKMILKPGDRVLLPSFGGMTVKLDDAKDEGKELQEEFALFKESDILATVQEL
jgi:chaperonin GroES